MAGRPKNRLELRRQYESAEPVDPMEDDPEETGEEVAEATERKAPKRKAKAAKPKPRAKSTKASKPAIRMRVVWVVLNDAFKPMATFDYADKEAALAKVEELTAKGKGSYFIQRSKEPMSDDAPGLGAAIPREEKIAAKKPKAAAVVADDPVADEEEEPEEFEEEEEDDGDHDSDGD